MDKEKELCEKLTFPVSLKQPGPGDGTFQCFIKRDKSNSTYHLYLCLNPAAVLLEKGEFMLSAKRTRRITCTEYIIAIDADNISRSGKSYLGKLRSNFLGTKFILDDTQPPYSSAHIPPLGRLSGRFSSKKVSPKVPSGSSNMAHITYELKVLDPRGPRRMQCIMQSILANENEGEKSTNEEEGEKSKLPLVLKNKAPRWHEKLQCWCLNFGGRVTVASV